MKGEPPIAYLSRADVEAAGGADPDSAERDIADVLALMRAGDAAMAAEAVLSLGDDPTAKAYALPARVGGRFAAIGVKWAVHRHRGADDAAGPGIASLTLINDPETGAPRAIVESALLTAVRTAAVTGLALGALAERSPPGRVALLGAGAQARAHLAMLGRRFPGLEAIRVWNRTPERADALAATQPDLPIHRFATVEEAVRGTDAVIAATAAPAPLLDASAVAPGRVIVQVGFDEVAFDAIDACDVVIVDLWGEFRLNSAKSLFRMHRAGRFEASRVAADLSGIVLDGWRPPPGASVYFSSFGLNVFDVALAARVAAAAGGNGKEGSWPGRSTPGR